MFSRIARQATRSGAIRPFLNATTSIQSRNMAQWVVISASGPDKTGIVAHVTDALQKANGNVAESRMTILGNDFALLTLATLPDATNVDSIVDTILPKDKFPEFSVQVRKTSADPVSSGPCKILRIDVEGPDQPGIISSLASTMASLGISIRDCETDTSSAPFAGYSVFTLKSVVAMPLSIDGEVFDKAVQEFQDKFGVDVEISRISGGTSDDK